MAFGELKKPSWSLHAVCAYWEMSLFGSSAQTDLTAKKKTKTNVIVREFFIISALAAFVRGLHAACIHAEQLPED
jgi:hypothetical protein